LGLPGRAAGAFFCGGGLRLLPNFRNLPHHHGRIHDTLKRRVCSTTRWILVSIANSTARDYGGYSPPTNFGMMFYFLEGYPLPLIRWGSQIREFCLLIIPHFIQLLLYSLLIRLAFKPRSLRRRRSTADCPSGFSGYTFTICKFFLSICEEFSRI
jgi:hypothetical protein